MCIACTHPCSPFCVPPQTPASPNDDFRMLCGLVTLLQPQAPLPRPVVGHQHQACVSQTYVLLSMTCWGFREPIPPKPHFFSPRFLTSQAPTNYLNSMNFNLDQKNQPHQKPSVFGMHHCVIPRSAMSGEAQGSSSVCLRHVPPCCTASEAIQVSLLILRDEIKRCVRKESNKTGQ